MSGKTFSIFTIEKDCIIAMLAFVQNITDIIQAYFVAWNCIGVTYIIELLTILSSDTPMSL